MISVILALFATFAAFVLGVPAAYALNSGRAECTNHRALLSFPSSPILITGLALAAVHGDDADARCRDEFVRRHVLVTLPYLVRTVTASLKQVDRSLEEAALTLGASPGWYFGAHTVRKSSGIAAGCLFASWFRSMIPDLPVVGGPQTLPLPFFLQNSMTKIFDRMRTSIAAMSSQDANRDLFAVIGLESSLPCVPRK